MTNIDTESEAELNEAFGENLIKDALTGYSQDLAKALQELRDANDLIDEARSSLEATQAYKDLMEAEAKAGTIEKKAQGLESKIREVLTEVYEETGDKSPAPGLGIRVYEDIQYPETKARDLAMRKGWSAALKLHRSNFNKLLSVFARAGAEIPEWIEIGERVTPTISKPKILETYAPQEDQAPF